MEITPGMRLKFFIPFQAKFDFCPATAKKAGAAQWSGHASPSQVCRRGARKGQHLLTGFQAPARTTGTQSELGKLLPKGGSTR